MGKKAKPLSGVRSVEAAAPKTSHGAVEIVMKATEPAFPWLWLVWSPHFCVAPGMHSPGKGDPAEGE